MSKQKRPAVAVTPTPKKEPRIAGAGPGPKRQPKTSVPDPGSYYEEFPVWRVGRMRTASPHGWHDIERSKFLVVIERLKSFESMPWKEILVHNKHGNHSITKSDLSESARNCLEEDWQGAEEVISLRVSALGRVFGILDRGAFTILWWDPTHAVCPSNLKNT